MLALIRRLALRCTCAALVLAAGPAHADDEPPARVERPRAIRMGGIVQTGGIFSGPLWDAAWILTYSRQLSAPLALELSGGPGNGGGRRGLHLGAGARLSLTPRGTSAVTLGFGPRVAVLDGYGPVAFLSMEIAWELRTRFGLTALVGGGWSAALTNSRRVGPQCLDRESGFGCDADRFRAGDGGPWLRGELGWAF